MFDLKEKGYNGPKGVSASFVFRTDTADENTIQATYTEDEYGFQNLPPSPSEGMIDAGGYVGSTAILYAQLYPQTKVICIEPLPENAELIRKNIERNGLKDRITLIEGALWGTSEGKTKIFYRDSSTVGKVHKFVGSAIKQYHETVSEDGVEAQNVSLVDVMVRLGVPRVRVLKMDIEGAEYETLRALPEEWQKGIQTIVGEYHNIFPGEVGDPRTKLYELLKNVFEDRSTSFETKTWGSFLFERRG
jgi:FkbM family methyltransferase